MIILGFGSKARQGKDTAGEAIVEHYSYQASLLKQHGLSYGLKVSVIKYATALYQEVNKAVKNGVWDDRSVIESRSIPNGQCQYYTMIPDWVQPDPNPQISELSPYGKHPKLLQWWGTEFRRNQDPDYWVNRAFESIPADTNLAIFTDVRFKNEAEAIKQKGGYLIEVIRLNQDGTRYYATDRPSDHLSETDLDDYNWDFNITSKSEVLTGELAVTIAEYIRGLHV